MKPVIGIITRPVFSEEHNKMYGVYDDMAKMVIESGGIPIGIVLSGNMDDILPLIDGLIFQGGDDFTDYEKDFILLAHQKNIKTLGICLGMQLMGTMFNGHLQEINNHKYINKDYVHKVIIKENSNLYKIFNKKAINVNSRHNFGLINTNLDVAGISDDGIVEAIEDSSKDFFIGVQWHPESMLNYDNEQLKLFQSFIRKCGERL